MSLKGETRNPDADMLDSLTGSDGVLTAGAMPSLELGTPEGMKNMCESIAGAGVVKSKAVRPKKETTEEVVPATSKEILRYMGKLSFFEGKKT